MPTTARPTVVPMIDGNSTRLTTVARKAAASVPMNTHHSQPHTGAVQLNIAIVTITARPGTTSSAMAPARAFQEAYRTAPSSVVNSWVSSSSSAVTT